MAGLEIMVQYIYVSKHVKGIYPRNMIKRRSQLDAKIVLWKEFTLKGL